MSLFKRIDPKKKGYRQNTKHMSSFKIDIIILSIENWNISNFFYIINLPAKSILLFEYKREKKQTNGTF